MATDIVQSLFGITPDMYEQGQQAQAEARALQYAKLNPFEQANYAIGRGASMLGGAIGRGLGGEDPERRKIELQQQLLSGIDLSDPKSLIQGAKDANQMGLPQLSLNLVDRAKALQESAGKIAVQNAQLAKALAPAKLTGDERYISALRTIETKIAKNEPITEIELSDANMAGQMLSKPRSFFDQASGQTVTIPATDPSKAFPRTYKLLGAEQETGGTTTPKPTTQQATPGNLPAGSQKEIGDIDANLKKLELSSPELQSFLGSLKSGDVKYNATSNTLDLLGAIALPALGLAEKGDQVKKDEIKRALTERVNSLLLMAKGTQTEGDASRAADQIASSTTYLSQNRMVGAIEGLMKTEAKLVSELGAKKNALQSQGRTEVPGVAPVKQEVKPVQQPSKSTELSKEQKIQLFINHNGGRPTRQEAEQALRNAGKL
jgi:hypothetical protein